MAKNKGSDGKGETKGPAWHAKHAETLGKTSCSKASRGIHVVEDLPTLGLADLIKGALVTGHRVEIGNATFEALEGGNKLTLVSASDAMLSRFVDMAQNVFVWVHDLIKNEFISPLKGPYADKQNAMWQHIVDSMSEEEVAELKARLENEREQRRAEIAKEREQVLEAAQFVGENDEIWNGATPASNIEATFEAMTSEVPAEIRVTTIGNDSHRGFVLGFFFDKKTNGMKIQVGHVVKKSEYANKVSRGLYLTCFGGKVPDVLPPSLPEGVKVIHHMVMGLDRKVRDPIMNGMYHAVRRITSVKEKPVFTLVKQEGFSSSSPAPIAQTKVMESPTTQAVKAAELTPTPVPQSAVAELVKSLREAGLSPQEIGQAVAAYNAENNTANKSA